MGKKRKVESAVEQGSTMPDVGESSEEKAAETETAQEISTNDDDIGESATVEQEIVEDAGKSEEIPMEAQPKPSKAKKKIDTQAKDEPSQEKSAPVGNGSSKLIQVEAQFTKWGYVDFWDYITLIAGIYALVFTILNSIDWFTANFSFGLLFAPAPNVIFVTSFTYGVAFFLYAIVIFFPFVAKLIVTKMKPKMPGLFPLESLKTQEDYRQFIAVIACFGSLLLTLLEPAVSFAQPLWLASFYVFSWEARLAHLPTMFALWIVIYAESFRKRFKKLPPNIPVV